MIFEDSQGQLWIGTGSNGMEGAGLNLFDPSTGKAVHYRHDGTEPASLSSNNISAIVEGPDGSMWIATGGFSLRGGGLDLFDPSTGKAVHFTHNPQNEYSLSSDDLMTLWLDPNGMLWIGSWAIGLNGMSLSEPGYFNRYQNDPYFPDSLRGDEIWSLFQDNLGILWIGTAHSGSFPEPGSQGSK